MREKIIGSLYYRGYSEGFARIRIYIFAKKRNIKVL